ncbi:MAG: hypothetical protein J6Y86_04145 [Pseudobutyrivibrio sp.]|nr:hypothetical protein [Pseudobutyrivibrio sp.]
MAAENTRALLDEFNTNVLEAIGEVTDLTALKELLKNPNLLDGYKIQCEEDKLWNQREKDFTALEQDKEIRLAELEIKKAEIEFRREQLILENGLKQDELKLRKEMHDDEMAMRNHENHRAIDANDIREKELELKAEENRISRRKMWLEFGFKTGTVVLGGVLTGLAIYVGNEGILNKAVIGIAESLVLRKA